MHRDVTFARCSGLVLLEFVCCRVSVAVQQKQEEKRQKEELYKEKDRERKRVQSSKKVTQVYGVKQHRSVCRGVNDFFKFLLIYCGVVIQIQFY